MHKSAKLIITFNAMMKPSTQDVISIQRAVGRCETAG